MSIINQIADIKNLYWAWEKAKAFYQPGDIWFDELQVSEFEADLHSELLSIQGDILGNTYVLQSIRPVAFPKSSDKEGPRTRQTFWISVRDQVTWLAAANILGRELDYEMPFWSYGNRLYISTFYDSNSETGKLELNFGYYRNSTKHTYRKWSQSWPLYRRHITLTAKYLAKGGNSKDLPEDTLEEKEAEMLTVNDNLNDDHPLKVKYINAAYWNKELSGELYWAGLDLKNFYPQLNLEVVKENIRIYVPDESLNILLESLFSFRIEFNGWNDEECKKIKLERTEFYTHMPTGLFVAGFLANVAMLKVDKEVDAKLKEQRNIAHFRYVDDHVILASSFEDMVTWISEYEKIIEANNVGAEFNLEKTQPEELADYIKAIKDNSYSSQSDIEESKKKAKEATKLDPAFPSPLMTQTLAKVSKIAGTEFQLLDPDEERSLIADIEHLLVTEFPDQELRRDTRVSFAARMLSNLVPQITVNTEKAYNLESALTQLKIEQKKQEKEGQKKEDISKEIETVKDALNKEYLSIERQENLLVKRTLKLLLKAIRDNHDKVRLWTRVIEFALKTGKVKILDVVNEIDSLKSKGEINDLSAGFINALTLQVLSQLLFKALNSTQSEHISNKQKRKSLLFIRNVITESVLNYFEGADINTSKFYEQDSLLLFKYSCGTILYLVNDGGEKEKDINLIAKYLLIDWANDPTLFFERLSYSLATWAWWTFNRVSLNNNRYAVLKIWDRINDNLDVSLPIDRNVILLFPRYLSQKLLNEIEQHKSDFLENEGWLFEVKIGLDQRKVSTDSFSFLTRVNSKTTVEFEKNITLYDWILWTKKLSTKLSTENRERLVFDPRLSEWMALEIIKKIAALIDDKTTTIDIEELFEQQSDYSICLHPNNFKLPKKWVEENSDSLTWDKLRQMVDHEHHYITMRAKDDLIYDKRFDFTDGKKESLYGDNHENSKAINAIGSLLICLLTKKFNLPYRWNPLGHQQVWLSMAKAELRNVALSSYTRDIIDGCFSNRNIETMMLQKLQAKKGMFLVNDTASDPPSIWNLKTFIQYVNLAQGKLKKQQLSVSNHQPRQLIPISLKQMKRISYQDQIEDTHENIQ